MARLIAALILIALALCGYLSLVHWQEDPHPLVIEAAADRWCDFPKSQRLPLMKPPGLYFRGGELKRGEDGGIS